MSHNNKVRREAKASESMAFTTAKSEDRGLRVNDDIKELREAKTSKNMACFSTAKG